LQEGDPFFIFEPNGFIHTVEFEAKEAFGSFEGPLALAEFFVRDWVHAVVFAWEEDVVYSMQDTPCDMFHLLFICRDDTGDEVVHVDLN